MATMKTTMSVPAGNPHSFAQEQRVELHHPDYPVLTVEVVALLSDRCTPHDAPVYGCVHNGDHFTVCEHQLKALSPTNRKKLN